MIIEYWCRVVLKSSFSIEDIAKIMIEFGDEYEYFDPLISSKDIEFSDNNLTVQIKDGNGRSVYGFINARPGRNYHWKLQLLQDCYAANICIIEANQCHSPNNG